MRNALTATALVMVCLAQAGCSGDRIDGAGANPSQAGPGLILTASPDQVTASPDDAPGPGAPESVATPKATRPQVPTGPVQSMPDLEVAITNEIADSSRHGSPNVQIQRRKFAQYQIIIGWTVTNLPGDPIAPTLARTDAAKILELIQRTRLPAYGSILLIVTGAIPLDADGGKKITRVVRAKYTAAGVRGTVFNPATIWSQTDDKSAEINEGFR
jgi:hypothetical protein